MINASWLCKIEQINIVQHSKYSIFIHSRNPHLIISAEPLGNATDYWLKHVNFTTFIYYANALTAAKHCSSVARFRLIFIKIPFGKKKMKNTIFDLLAFTTHIAHIRPTLIFEKHVLRKMNERIKPFGLWQTRHMCVGGLTKIVTQWIWFQFCFSSYLNGCYLFSINYGFSFLWSLSRFELWCIAFWIFFNLLVVVVSSAIHFLSFVMIIITDSICRELGRRVLK